MALDLQFRNRLGTPVDPVPFLVVSLLGFTVAYSFGPIYLTELGLPLGPSLGICGLLVAGSTLASYHRYVWTARPDLRAEVPPAARFRRLALGVAVGVALIGLLSLPLALG